MSVKKTTIYVVLISTILAGGIIALALFTSPDTNAVAESSSAGQLTFSEDEWDFGTISMITFLLTHRTPFRTVVTTTQGEDNT